MSQDTSYRSWCRIGRAGAPSRDAADVLAPPPVIYGIAFAAGFGLDTLLPAVSLPQPVARWTGVALLAAGGALAAWFAAALLRAGTAVHPAHPTTALVTTGPYAFSRNPGYLGMALAYAGIALVAGAPWALATLVPALVVVDRCVILPEERYLAGKFGSEYARYAAKARRWL